MASGAGIDDVRAESILGLSSTPGENSSRIPIGELASIVIGISGDFSSYLIVISHQIAGAEM